MGMICSAFFCAGLLSLAAWFSDSVLSFSSVGFGCLWVSPVGVGPGAVGGIPVLVSGCCLAAVGANRPLPSIPAGGFCTCGWACFWPCWLEGLERGLCWLAGACWRGEPIAWCLGEGCGAGRGRSSRPPPDISRWVWQVRHSHSFFCNTDMKTLNVRFYHKNIACFCCSKAIIYNKIHSSCYIFIQNSFRSLFLYHVMFSSECAMWNMCAFWSLRVYLMRQSHTKSPTWWGGGGQENKLFPGLIYILSNMHISCLQTAAPSFHHISFSLSSPCTTPFTHMVSIFSLPFVDEQRSSRKRLQRVKRGRAR